jgi:hypothetical protein
VKAAQRLLDNNGLDWRAKFHKPHLGTNPQKWLIEQVKLEIEAFYQEGSDRI